MGADTDLLAQEDLIIERERKLEAERLKLREKQREIVKMDQKWRNQKLIDKRIDLENELTADSHAKQLCLIQSQDLVLKRKEKELQLRDENLNSVGAELNTKIHEYNLRATEMERRTHVLRRAEEKEQLKKKELELRRKEQRRKEQKKETRGGETDGKDKRD